MFHTAHVVTISCQADDCTDRVQAIADSAHSARYEASTIAECDGWERYSGSNGGDFHRCLMHRSDAPVSLVKSYV